MMDKSSAEKWIVVSALVVIGVYGYRRLTEAATAGGLSNLIGLGNPVPLAQFITAWGFLYFCLGLTAEAAPGVGGSMAMLIAVSDLLTNAPAVLGDVVKHEKPPATPPAGKKTSTTTTPPKAKPFPGKGFTG